jgi:hypothetical protein
VLLVLLVLLVLRLLLLLLVRRSQTLTALFLKPSKCPFW